MILNLHLEIILLQHLILHCSLLFHIFQQYIQKAYKFVKENYPENYNKTETINIQDPYMILGKKRTDENIKFVHNFYKEQGKIKNINYFEIHEEISDILTAKYKDVIV